MIDILDCLGTNLKDFFSEGVDEKIVFRKEDIFEMQNNELNHLIKWLVPNAQKNTMEPILLYLEPNGNSEKHDPHDGEEFGFVLSGSINIHLGGRKYKAKKGESFYFKPSSVHSIENSGKRQAVVLWVSCPPSF